MRSAWFDREHSIKYIFRLFFKVASTYIDLYPSYGASVLYLFLLGIYSNTLSLQKNCWILHNNIYSRGNKVWCIQYVVKMSYNIIHPLVELSRIVNCLHGLVVLWNMCAKLFNIIAVFLVYYHYFIWRPWSYQVLFGVAWLGCKGCLFSSFILFFLWTEIVTCLILNIIIKRGRDQRYNSNMIRILYMSSRYFTHNCHVVVILKNAVCISLNILKTSWICYWINQRLSD